MAAHLLLIKNECVRLCPRNKEIKDGDLEKLGKEYTGCREAIKLGRDERKHGSLKSHFTPKATEMELADLAWIKFFATNDIVFSKLRDKHFVNAIKETAKCSQIHSGPSKQQTPNLMNIEIERLEKDFAKVLESVGGPTQSAGPGLFFVCN